MVKPIVFFCILASSIVAYQNCTTDVISSLDHASTVPFVLSPACIDESKAVTLNVSSSLQNFSLQCKRVIPVLDDQYLDCGGIALDNEGSESYYIGENSLLLNNLTQDQYQFFIRTVQIVSGTKKFGQAHEIDLKKC